MAWSNITNGEDGLSVRNKLNEMANAVALRSNVETELFTLVGADMNTTEDQKFEKTLDFSKYIITRIIAEDASVPLSGAIGGIFTAPSKGGIAVVAASQAWANLNSTTKVMFPAVAAAGVSKLEGDLYLSLTTPLGSAGTCKLTIMGVLRT